MWTIVATALKVAIPIQEEMALARLAVLPVSVPYSVIMFSVFHSYHAIKVGHEADLRRLVDLNSFSEISIRFEKALHLFCKAERWGVSKKAFDTVRHIKLP